MSIIFEFVLLGVFAAGLIYLFMFLKARTPDNQPYKYATGLAILAAILLFWVNNAVGIIGSENNDANMLFFGVLVIGFVGSLIARFKPSGMPYARFVTASAQILVGVTALALGWGASANMWPKDVIGATVFFTAFWAGSGSLYRNAAGVVRRAKENKEV